MKGKITKFDNVYPMSCWPICTAYLNILLSGCAMNCEEKNFPWKPASFASLCPVPLDPCPMKHCLRGRVTLGPPTP